MAAYRTAARLFPGLHLPLTGMGMEYQRMNNLHLAEQMFLQVNDALCRLALVAGQALCAVCFTAVVTQAPAEAPVRNSAVVTVTNCYQAAPR